MKKKTILVLAKRIRMTYADFLLKRPFVLFTVAYSLGIVLAMSVLNSYSALAITGLFVCFSLFWILPFGMAKLKYFLAFLCLFFLGYLSSYSKNSSKSNTVFQDSYTPGSFLEAKVVEVSHSQKLWNKAILQLRYLYQFNEKIPIDETVLFLINQDSSTIEKGTIVLLNSEIEPIRNKGNPGEFDGEHFWKAKGISKMAFLQDGQFMVLTNEQNWMEKWFYHLDRSLSKLFEKKLHPEAVGVAKALVLGDRDHLDSESLRAFGNTGAMHVLAVSGLHIGLILNMLLFFFGLFPRQIGKYRATVLALVIIWFYALLTGFSPSVIRAVVMFSMLTYAKLSGKNHNPLNVLLASALVILVYDPLILYDLGFQLSYLAMLGIFLIYKPILGLFFVENKWLRTVWEGTAISLAAQVFTLPLTLYCFHQFPNYFLIANLGMMVFSNIILLIGVLFILLHLVPFLNVLLAWSLSFLVIAMFVFVQWVDGIPGSTASGFEFTMGNVILLYIILALILSSLRFKKQWRFFSGMGIVALCAVLVFQRYQSIEKNEFIIFNDSKLTFCVKIDQEIFCFYEHDKQLKRASYLVESYAKIRPGKIQYCKLDTQRKIHLRKAEFSLTCENSFNECKIVVNDQPFTVVKNINFENSTGIRSDNIYMPWIDISDVQGHFLQTGAFVRLLNSNL